MDSSTSTMFGLPSSFKAGIDWFDFRWTETQRKNGQMSWHFDFWLQLGTFLMFCWRFRVDSIVWHPEFLDKKGRPAGWRLNFSPGASITWHWEEVSPHVEGRRDLVSKRHYWIATESTCTWPLTKIDFGGNSVRCIVAFIQSYGTTALSWLKWFATKKNWLESHLWCLHFVMQFCI